jgi:hypothetical protein
MEQELVEFLRDYKAEKILKAKWYSTITNIILIGMVVVLGVYIYNNIEAFKSLGQDVCKLCYSQNNLSTISLIKP